MVAIFKGNLRIPEEKWNWGEVVRYMDKEKEKFWLGRLLGHGLMITKEKPSILEVTW